MQEPNIRRIETFLLKRILLSVSVILSTLMLSHAQSKTANRNGDWNSSNTWSPSGVPSDNDIILIPAGRTVTVRGTDHTLNNAILIIEGTLVMESTCSICTNYGSLTFTGPDSGVIIENGGQVLDGTAFGGDTHFISVQEHTFWSGDDCSSNCGDIEGNYTSSGSTNMPASLSNPLPVEMLYFSGSYKNKIIWLKWATASEMNNSHFEVERATNDLVFTKVGEVSGAGNSTQLIEYSFKDKQISLVNSSMLYYRLKQVDYDGQYQYSHIIAVQNEFSEVLRIWPTPFTDQITISLSSSSIDYVHVKLYDIKGQQWFSQSYHVKGMNTLEVNELYELRPGIYFIELISNAFHHREKIIK